MQCHLVALVDLIAQKQLLGAKRTGMANGGVKYSEKVTEFLVVAKSMLEKQISIMTTSRILLTMVAEKINHYETVSNTTLTL